MAYRAAVCDDSAADADYVRGIVAHWAEQRGVALECRAFSSAEQFLFCYAEDKNFDLLLLDVEMPGADGVTAALLYTAYCAIFLPLCPNNRQNRPDAGRCHCLCRRRCFPCAEKQHRRPRTRRRAGSGRKSGSKFLFFICLFLFRLHLPPCMPFSA